MSDYQLLPKPTKHPLIRLHSTVHNQTLIRTVLGGFVNEDGGNPVLIVDNDARHADADTPTGILWELLFGVGDDPVDSRPRGTMILGAWRTFLATPEGGTFQYGTRTMRRLTRQEIEMYTVKDIPFTKRTL